MKWLTITYDRLDSVKGKLLRFVQQHGEKRITRKAAEWLIHLKPLELSKEENRILAAVEDSRLVALFAVGDLGRSEAFIVVHRDYRNRGIAKELMRRMCEAIPCLYVRVAEDNRASLRLCEASGFHPYARTLGPTGKPTILLIRHGNLNS